MRELVGGPVSLIPNEYDKNQSINSYIFRKKYTCDVKIVDLRAM